MTADDSPRGRARDSAAAPRKEGGRLGEACALFRLLSHQAEPVPASSSGQARPAIEGAISLAEQAIAEARNQSDRRLEICGLYMLSQMLRYADRPEEAARTAEHAYQQLPEDDRETLMKAQKAAETAIAEARQKGDKKAEGSAYFNLGLVLDRLGLTEAGHNADAIWSLCWDQSYREQAEAARRAAAAEISDARLRGDWRAEVRALSRLSGLLEQVFFREEAAEADRQSVQVAGEARARQRVESAASAISAAQAAGDQAAEALELLALGRALTVLNRPAEAEDRFEQAEHLIRAIVDAAKLAAAEARNPAAPLEELSTLTPLWKALSGAGREDEARHMADQVAQLNPGPAAGSRAGAAAPPAVTNHASHATADSVIQVGALHGDLRIYGRPRSPAPALQISVSTQQSRTSWYEYEGKHLGSPDTEIRVIVESSGEQAVILRQLRPVITRRLPEAGGGAIAAIMTPREFEVSLDPARRARLPGPKWYDACLDEQELDLDAAFAAGEEDFPFTVTASDPEYFVIRPRASSMPGATLWRLELDWSCLGQHGTMTIDNSGRPFVR